MTATLCPPPRYRPAEDPSASSDLELVDEITRTIGLELMAWQRLVFEVGLETVAGSYKWRTVVCLVGRQNGKTTAVVVRIALELLESIRSGEARSIGYTAQDRNLARIKFDEYVDELLRIPAIASELEKVTYANGREELVLANGSTFFVFTPNGKGLRGRTLDLVIVDEGLEQKLELLDAVQPTMLTKRNAQLWIISNAGDERSELLLRFREIGRKMDPDDRVALIEWSPLDARFDPGDRKVWEQCVPSLLEEHGVTFEGVEDLYRTMEPDRFAREVLCSWPHFGAITAIDLEKWAELEDRSAVMPATDVSFGLAVDPDREHAAISSAGRLRGGDVLVEVVDSRDGNPSWLVDRVSAIHRANRRSTFIVDGGGPAGSLIPDLEDLGVRLEIYGMRDYARACGRLDDAVEEGELVHRGQWELDDAVDGAAKRPLADSWAFHRRAGANITPIEAAALAHYHAKTSRRSTPRIH